MARLPGKSRHKADLNGLAHHKNLPAHLPSLYIYVQYSTVYTQEVGPIFALAERAPTPPALSSTVSFAYTQKKTLNLAAG